MAVPAPAAPARISARHKCVQGHSSRVYVQDVRAWPYHLMRRTSPIRTRAEGNLKHKDIEVCSNPARPANINNIIRTLVQNICTNYHSYTYLIPALGIVESRQYEVLLLLQTRAYLTLTVLVSNTHPLNRVRHCLARVPSPARTQPTLPYSQVRVLV